MRSFTKVRTGNNDLDRVQDNIASALAPLTSLPLVGGVLIQSIALKSGGAANYVPHTLGRKPIGYIVSRQRAQADIWDGQDQNANPSLSYLLYASAPCTIDLLFF